MAILDSTSGGAIRADALGITNYPFTMAAWCHPTDTSTNHGQICGIGVSTWAHHHSLWISATLRQPLQVSRFDSGTENVNTLGTAVPLDTWRPVVARWTASDNRSVYLNTLASKKDTSVDVGGFGSTINAFQVGRFPASSARIFKGLITHVAVWNKALSESEVEAFLQAGNPLAISPDDSSLVGYWVDTFEDVSGTWYWRDESGNNNDLTLESGAVRNTTTTGPVVDDPPSLTDPGITITGIKEPNVTDALVDDVTNARVKVWSGTDDTGAEAELFTEVPITSGTLSTGLEGPPEIDAVVTVEVMWTVGTERKLFITETTVVDIGSGS